MILYCCQDLIFATKIRSTAETLGVPTQAIRDAAAIETLEKPGEVGAVMVDLELGDTASQLIERAARELGGAAVIGFGSHVAREQLQAARDAGADQVLPRSAFTNQLPDLLRRHAQPQDAPRA